VRKERGGERRAGRREKERERERERESEDADRGPKVREGHCERKREREKGRPSSSPRKSGRRKREKDAATSRGARGRAQREPKEGRGMRGMRSSAQLWEFAIAFPLRGMERRRMRESQGEGGSARGETRGWISERRDSAIVSIADEPRTSPRAANEVGEGDERRRRGEEEGRSPRFMSGIARR